MNYSSILQSQLCASVAALDRCQADLRRRCDVRNVHAVRVAVRRFRAQLWSMKPWIRREAYRLCATRLKAIARKLGPLRDLDVLGDMLLTQIAGEVGLSHTRRSGLQACIRRQRMEAGRKLRAQIHTARYAQQSRQVRDQVADPGLFRKSVAADRASWRKRILRAVGDFDAKAQRAVKADLHRIRILAKRCRYSLEALGPDMPRKTHRRMKALQTKLGTYCDVRLAAEWLKRPRALQDEVLRKRLLRTARALANRRAVAVLRELRRRSARGNRAICAELR